MAAHAHEPEGKIRKEMYLRDVVKDHPETLAVFKKYFGSMALVLPGTRVETIEFNCAMHDMSHIPVLEELNRIVS